MDILKTIQEEREEFNALPTSEKLKRKREEGIASLLRVGYITPEEAKTYSEQLTELPQDRKGLIVAYFLLGIGIRHIDTEMSERIREIVGSFRIQERGLHGRALLEGFSPEERTRWTEELSEAQILADITKAETFVDAKRRRIRAKLIPFQTLLTATSLVMDEEDEEGNAIPYLREELKRQGYRAKAKKLNKADREAIQGAASHYIDLLELSLLNGVGTLRNEEYRSLQDEDGYFKEDFYYRDVYDEALLEFVTYQVLEETIAHFYADGTAREAISLLSEFYLKISERGIIKETLKGTKFESLTEEVRIC